MMFYALKIPNDQFEKIWEGREYIEFKTEHNNFSIGDKLCVLSYTFDFFGNPIKYQGRSLLCFVECVLTHDEYPFSVAEGYLLIGVEIAERINNGIVLKKEKMK